MDDLVFEATPVYKRLWFLTDEAAEASYKAELLEEGKKILLAQLMTNDTAREIGSMAAKEAYAYAHPEYKKHIELMCEARKIATQAKGKLKAAEVWVEVNRTIQANERILARHG